MAFSPEDLTRTTPILFLTRWITHICAPTFMLLASAGACLQLDREKSPRLLSRFLWTRGLWLIVVELTIMRLGMNFSLGPPNPVLLIVLTALGLSMIVLAALIHLPRSWLLVFSAAVIVLHNLLDPVQASRFGPWALGWNLLHQPGVFTVGALPVVVSYPLIPWFAVMALGFSCGPVLRMDAVCRRRVLHDGRPVDDRVRARAGGQRVWRSVSMVRADLAHLHRPLVLFARRNIRRRSSSC